jgi:hypothetical protein
MRVSACQLGWVVAGLAWVMAAGGCGTKVEDAEDVEDILGLDAGTLEGLTKIPVCGDMTLEELSTQDTITDSCRAEIDNYLPEEQTSYQDVIVTLGTDTSSTDGSLLVYLHGADTAGNALTADAFASATVTVTIAGEATVLAEGEFTVSLVADVPRDLISLSIVNDYSGSMLVDDLRTVAQLETDLFTVLPPVYEAEVTVFSTEATLKQGFSSSRDELLAAVDYDAEYSRQSTALYDAVGAALESLVSRTRPVRVLMVSTDGQENASEQYTQSELIDTINDNGVIVVMLGALLADVDELRDLAGSRGVYFYTPYYSDMRELMAEYFNSLEQMVELSIPEAYADAEAIQIEVGEQSTTVEPQAETASGSG